MIKNFTNSVIASISLNALMLYAVTTVLPGVVYQGDLKLFLIAGFIIGLFNLVFKPILKLFSLPLIFITGGLFIIIINTIGLYVTTYFISMLTISNIMLDFGTVTNYLIAGLIFGILNSIVTLIAK